MNKFLKDLEKELKKLKVNQKEIDEILADHKEMIEAAKQEGLNDDEISNKFGNPSKVASELHRDTKVEDSDMDFELGDLESLAQFDTEEYNFVKAFNFIPDEINFDIKLLSDDLILCDYDGEDIKIYEKGVKDIEMYDISLENNTFILKKKSSKKMFKAFSFSSDSGKFLVLIPKDLKSNSFNYHAVSGDVTINHLVVNSFKIKSTSGDISLSNVELGKVDFSLVNGDVDIIGMKASSFDISLINGDVEIEKGIISGNMHVHTVSGDLELKNVECESASFKTVSGDVEGKNFYVNEISLKSVSGDVNIENDDKSREINVISKKTLSGDVKIN